LGISGGTLDPETAQSYDLPVEGGAIVNNVFEGTPAGEAGLQAGDIIVAIDGTTILSMDELVVEIRKHQVGDMVTIDFYREDSREQVVVTLEEKPADL
jgi:serine protease Do